MRVSFEANAFSSLVLERSMLSGKDSNLLNSLIQDYYRERMVAPIVPQIAKAAYKNFTEALAQGLDSTESMYIGNFVDESLRSIASLMIRYDENFAVVGNGGIEELLSLIGGKLHGSVVTLGSVSGCIVFDQSMTTIRVKRLVT